MGRFINQNWFKLAILLINLLFGIYYFYISPQNRTSNEHSSHDLSLQAQCAAGAAAFYKQGRYDEDDQGYSSYYTNHWNEKLGKCFIQINSISTKSNFASIDVFDAFEGKHYAAFVGHNDCDPVILSNLKECQIDAGDIWLDGNDAKNPADYHIGFQGVSVGPGIGGANTKKLFLDKIQPFMND